MVPSQWINQMIQFNKTAFDNSYKAMETLGRQNEKITNSLLEESVWLPEGGKKAVKEWMQVYKKGCDDLKKTADQNYKTVEEFFTGLAK